MNDQEWQRACERLGLAKPWPLEIGRGFDVPDRDDPATFLRVVTAIRRAGWTSHFGRLVIVDDALGARMSNKAVGGGVEATEHEVAAALYAAVCAAFGQEQP